MKETERIADQLDRAIRGETWSGRPLGEIVAALDAEAAASHPAPGGMSAWETLAHIGTWLRISRIRLGGTASTPTPEEDFPTVANQGESAWRDAWRTADREARELATAIRAFDPARLGDGVPGQTYDVYHLLHGVVQHTLYHGGQIALLTRLAKAGLPKR